MVEKALELDEVPVGAVVFDPADNRIVASAHNLTRTGCDASAHAEVMAIRRAGAAVGRSRLDGLALYVTLEPCAMCAGAIAHSGLSRLFYGAADEKMGAVANGVRYLDHPSSHHKIAVQGGIEAEKAAKILQDFFKGKRKK